MPNPIRSIKTVKKITSSDGFLIQSKCRRESYCNSTGNAKDKIRRWSAGADESSKNFPVQPGFFPFGLPTMAQRVRTSATGGHFISAENARVACAPLKDSIQTLS
jgi:hypothetical protein